MIQKASSLIVFPDGRNMEFYFMSCVFCTSTGIKYFMATCGKQNCDSVCASFGLQCAGTGQSFPNSSALSIFDQELPVIRKTTQIITFTKTNQTIYLLRRHPKICNGQVDALDSKLYPVLLTVTRPIMTTSVDSAHVKTLQVGVSFCYYFIIKLLFFSSSLSVTLLFLSPTSAFNFLFLSFEPVFIVKQLF